MREKLIAWAYTIGVAVEGGTTAFASAYSKTKDFWVSLGIGMSGLFSRGLAVHYFQGPSIVASASAPALPLPSEPAPSTAPLLGVSEKEAVADAKEIRSSTTSRVLQGGYILVDSFNCLLSRYFIFNAFFATFAIDLGNEIFGAIVISDFAIAQLFALLTATYAATKELADNGAKPIYAKALKPLAHETVRTVVCYAGSAEFVVANYLVGWVTLAGSIVNDLTEDEIIRDVVPILTAVISLIIGWVLFCQTYLFDGTYMNDNLDTIDPSKKNLIARSLPHWLLKLADKTLFIAAPVSGLSSGTSVVIGLSQYVPKPAKWPVVGIAGVLNALGIWKGAELSQVREARERLDEMLGRRPVSTGGVAINSEGEGSVLSVASV